MPVCPHGSAVNPGVPEVIILDPYLAPSGIPALLDWLRPYLPFLPRLEIDTVALCAVDPPGLPALITRDDIVELVLGTKYDLVQIARAKIEQLLKHYFWYTFCHCLIDSTPAPATPPSAPANLPVINPPVFFPIGNKPPCLVREWYGEIFPSQFMGLIAPIAIPTPGPIYLRYTNLFTHIGTVHNNWNIYFDFYNAAGAIISRYTTGAFHPSYQEVIPIPTGATRLDVLGTHQAPGNSLDGLRVTVEFWCGGETPTSPNSACCPPDPIIAAALSRIEQLVTLIQRQAVPFATVNGPTHVGLVGDGEIAVHALLGILVDVSSIPPGSGVESGQPDTYFDLGWVRAGYASGWGPRERIDAIQRVIAPWLGDVTKVGYSLEPNAEVNITELRREP